MISINDFVDQFTYVGAALSGDPKKFSTAYVDLESFVLDATQHLSYDTRVTHAFTLWVKRYGCLLSPAKLRRLIRSGAPFEPTTLGVVIDLIDGNRHRLQNWAILKPFLKKVKHRPLFPHLPLPRKNLNPHFYKWGWVAPSMREPEEKYLVSTQAAFKRCPELRYRAEGVSPVAADIRAWAEKNRDSSSTLYQIAKDIHHPRAQVNGFYRQLASLQILGSHAVD